MEALRSVPRFGVAPMLLPCRRCASKAHIIGTNKRRAGGRARAVRSPVPTVLAGGGAGSENLNGAIPAARREQEKFRILKFHVEIAGRAQKRCARLFKAVMVRRAAVRTERAAERDWFAVEDRKAARPTTLLHRIPPPRTGPRGPARGHRPVFLAALPRPTPGVESRGFRTVDQR
jgi:hypothetical protein